MPGELDEISATLGALTKGQEYAREQRERLEAMFQTFAREMKNWRAAEANKQARRHQENSTRLTSIENRLAAIEGPIAARKSRWRLIRKALAWAVATGIALAAAIGAYRHGGH